MSHFSRIVSLFLLALWLPATEHCALEAAGVVFNVCHDDAGDADQSCANDGCAALESSHYRGTLQVIQVGPPTLHNCVRLVCLAATVPLPEATVLASGAFPDRPKAWVPIWHFVRRAAPPSRAPASLLA